MKPINQKILSELLVKAKISPRKRSHFNIHEQLSDPIQRLMVAIEAGSYIRPHRHPEPNKWECFFIFKGSAEILIFSNNGKVEEKMHIAEGCDAIGIEIPPGVWHTLVASSAESVLLELKPGPYSPLSEIDFASWAPPENNEHCFRFVEWFRNADIGGVPPEVSFQQYPNATG